jgi:hypothetical protein
VLSWTGNDEAPVLSDDGTHVIFRRRRFTDADARSDLYCARVGDGHIDLVVRDDPATFLDRRKLLPLTDFFNVGFMPDGRRGVFSVHDGRGEAIATVELATKNVTWLASGFGYQHVLIRTGPNKGNLLVVAHELSGAPDYGANDRCYLVHGRSGRKLRDVTGVDPECGESEAMRRALGF